MMINLDNHIGDTIKWLHPRQSCFQQDLVLAEIPLWVCCLCGWLDAALVFSEVHHKLYWFWVHLAGVQVQLDVKYCIIQP